MDDVAGQRDDRVQVAPGVTNNCNYTPATTTITWDGVHTMSHEFGHALHGLFATTKYPSLSGTSTPRDFVEFPLPGQRVLGNGARIWVLPANLLAKLEAASSFNQGFETLEIMAATLLDQAWHQTPLAELPTSAEEVEAFEQRALAAWGGDPPRPAALPLGLLQLHQPGRGRLLRLHLGAGDGRRRRGLVHRRTAVERRENGDYFRQPAAPGGSVDPLETYRAFRGRDPELGLPVGAARSSPVRGAPGLAA